jgi:hypothetical protein
MKRWSDDAAANLPTRNQRVSGGQLAKRTERSFTCGFFNLRRSHFLVSYQEKPDLFPQPD